MTHRSVGKEEESILRVFQHLIWRAVKVRRVLGTLYNQGSWNQYVSSHFISPARNKSEYTKIILWNGLAKMALL